MNYIIVNANESMQIGSGDTKEEALTDALYNLRNESYCDSDYAEKEAELLDDLKKSELFQDSYTDWSHYKRVGE